MTRRASANAWTPSWARPFTLGLCFTRASATATSNAPAPDTTLPEETQRKRGCSENPSQIAFVHKRARTMRKGSLKSLCWSANTCRRDWNAPNAEEKTRVTVAQTWKARENHDSVPGCSLCKSDQLKTPTKEERRDYFQVFILIKTPLVEKKKKRKEINLR